MSARPGDPDDPAVVDDAAFEATPFLARHATWVAVGVFVVATTAAVALLIPGHYWGDDWTLYVRQAEALWHGRASRVVADVTFTARNSTMREFTPEGYPWGTPLLLSLPIEVFGRSIATMKVTMALSFGLAAAAWYLVGRRWIGPVAALGGTALIVVSLPLLAWTNLIASDIPYLAAVGLAVLVFARRCTGQAVSWRSCLAVGAAAALAFSFRQEGLAVLLAAILAFAMQRWKSAGSSDTSPATRVRLALRGAASDAAVAAATFATITLVVQLLLPSQLLPRYSTAGPGRIRPNLSFFSRSVASQFGLYDQLDARVEAFDTPVLGWLLIVAVIAGAVVGSWVVFRRHDPLDVLLIAIAVSHAYGALTFPFPDTRYMFVPFAIACLLIADGFESAARRLVASWRSAGAHSIVIVTAALIGGLVANQVSPYVTTARGAADARRIDQPAFSPLEPEPQEMFATVRSLTAPDDVLAFSAARAMTYFTDRRSVQVRGDDPIPAVAGWTVVEQLPDGSMPLPPGFVVEWRNERYAVLRLAAAP
jgi:4-amino-4-deoxy-L-arabinose transferase-like glycosyltransferase